MDIFTGSVQSTNGRNIYLQQYNSKNPKHTSTLEGTGKFPVYLLGHLTSLDVTHGAIRGYTLSFAYGTVGSMSTGWGYFRSKKMSLYIPPIVGSDEFFLVRKCLLTKEVEVNRLYMRQDDHSPIAIEYEWSFEIIKSL